MFDGSGSFLVSISSESEARAAQARMRQAGDPLHVLVRRLVDRYFASLNAPTKKAEWQEMQRLDIYVHGYRDYLSSKRAGKTPGEIGYGLRNRPWLASLASSQERGELDSLLASYEARKREWDEAARRVVRWPLSPP
jgi:hypothetical protein